MTIFEKLGNEFLKLTLSERQYRILVVREREHQAPLKISVQKAIDGDLKRKVVASGNSGHVYLPKKLIGKTVLITEVEQ